MAVRKWGMEQGARGRDSPATLGNEPQVYGRISCGPAYHGRLADLRLPKQISVVMRSNQLDTQIGRALWLEVGRVLYLCGTGMTEMQTHFREVTPSSPSSMSMDWASDVG